jgi:hypothetical protein
MPVGSGDMAIETHGITPVPEDNRYGTPWRLFTVWFAPQMNMTGVFTGSLAIVFGLGFWLGLLAMIIGTVLGSLPVAYLSTWGPRTGTGQLPASRSVPRWSSRPSSSGSPRSPGTGLSACSAARRCRCCCTSRSGSAF